MMPHTFHPMALEPWLLQRTLLISPLHCDAFTDVIQISHQLSHRGCAWNHVWYKKYTQRKAVQRDKAVWGVRCNLDSMEYESPGVNVSQKVQLCRKMDKLYKRMSYSPCTVELV